MLRVITDFDGPIMDVSERYYQVYQYCLEQTKSDQQPIHQLSKTEFWQLKRARVPEYKIGIKSGLDETQAQKFAQIRKNTVHTLPYLSYDRVLPNAISALEKLQYLGIDLVVMTMRREKELAEAFERYDLARFFPPNRRYCLSNDYIKTTDIEDKPLLMKKAVNELPPASDLWMIGDTEADIVAAKQSQVKIIGVLSGIRDREHLEQYQPNFIANNLTEAIDLVLQHTLSAQKATS